MKKQIRLADIPDLDFAEHLDTDQAIADYLTVILEENDPALLVRRTRRYCTRTRHEPECQGIRHFP